MTDNWNVYTISPLSKGLTQTLVREVTPQINLNSVPSPLWIFNLVGKTYSGSPTFFNSVILGPHTLMIAISSLPLAQPCSLSHTGLFFLKSNVTISYLGQIWSKFLLLFTSNSSSSSRGIEGAPADISLPLHPSLLIQHPSPLIQNLSLLIQYPSLHQHSNFLKDPAKKSF